MWGALADGALDRVVVVSPHFDDAALGAAHLLASHPGGTVVTVLAGRPPSYPDPVSAWDAAGGFTAGDDVVAVRREEDRAAMASWAPGRCGWSSPTTSTWPRDERPDPGEVAPELARAVADAGPTAVFLPMGLANPGPRPHPRRRPAGPGRPGGRRHPVRLVLLRGRRLLAPARAPRLAGGQALPRRAVAHARHRPRRPRRGGQAGGHRVLPEPARARCERDHLLEERLEANVPEQYWRLDPPPAGWEGLSSADDLTGGSTARPVEPTATGGAR